MELTLKTIIEFRDEMREFRAETRKTLAEHAHRLNLIGTTTTGLKVDAGVLLGTVPAISERLDSLEARVEALERRD